MLLSKRGWVPVLSAFSNAQRRYLFAFALLGASPVCAIAESEPSAAEVEYQNLVRQFTAHDLDPAAMGKSVRSYLRRHKTSERAGVLKWYLDVSTNRIDQIRKDVVGVWAWSDTDRLAYAFNADGSCVFFTRGSQMGSFEAPAASIPGHEGCWQDSDKALVTQPSMRTTVNAIINSKDELELTVHCQHFDDERPSRLGPLEGLVVDADQILARDGWMGVRPADKLNEGALLKKVAKTDQTLRTCRNKDDEEREKWREAENLW